MSLCFKFGSGIRWNVFILALTKAQKLKIKQLNIKLLYLFNLQTYI